MEQLIQLPWCQINPSLSVHRIYSAPQTFPEYKRESFTRLRVSSHSLRVETGRWGRLPREERICPCDNRSIQDEFHVIENCPRTRITRENYPNLNFSVPELFNCDPDSIIAFSYDVLKVFSR